jgi:hypothetical protein
MPAIAPIFVPPAGTSLIEPNSPVTNKLILRGHFRSGMRQSDTKGLGGRRLEKMPTETRYPLRALWDIVFGERSN